MPTPMERAVALNRDNTSATLPFRPPLLPLLDRLHCSSWETELRTSASAWEVKQATPDLWHMLPLSMGIYMFVWRPPIGFHKAASNSSEEFGWVLYIGKTGGGASKNNFKLRYRYEYSKYLKGDPAEIFNKQAVSRREDMFRRYLLLQPLEFWWAEVHDAEHISKLEKELIRTFAPPLNVQHATLTRSQTRSAF